MRARTAPLAPRPGLKALAAVADTSLAAISTEGIVFALGPRINAAGRLGDAGKAVDLMLAETDAEAALIAAQLEAYNTERRARDQAVQAEPPCDGRGAAPRTAASTAVVLYHPDWHLGVIGIVASRLVERYHRPAIMMSPTTGGMVKGSARSIGGISIHNALAEVRRVARRLRRPRLRGRPHAARREGARLPARLQRRGGARFPQAGATTPTYDVDAPLALDGITGRFWSVLKQFGPHGPENPTPVFFRPKASKSSEGPRRTVATSSA